MIYFCDMSRLLMFGISYGRLKGGPASGPSTSTQAGVSGGAEGRPAGGKRKDTEHTGSEDDEQDMPPAKVRKSNHKRTRKD